MGENIFIYLIAVASFSFAVYNGICLILKRGKTANTVGTIISIKSPNPETAKARNSKWAELAYTVDGRDYTSQNRIQVPMTAQIGSHVTVRYDIFQPEKLYSFSLSKVLVALLIAAVCVIAAVFHLV